MNWTKIVLRINRLGATWTALEQESGVSRRTFYNWHRGRTKPDQHKLKGFVDAIERLEAKDKRR